MVLPMCVCEQLHLKHHIVGANMHERVHTSELNAGFLRYIYVYICIFCKFYIAYVFNTVV